MKRSGLQPDADAAALLAERVEGNLLAAQQEIDKLALLVPPGPVSAEMLQQVVANSARYDVFQLADAALAGDARRALTILEGLRSEGVEATLVLWSVTRAVRTVWKLLAQGGAANLPHWQRTPGLESALRRIRRGAIPGMLRAARRADRTIKGRAAGDAWDAIEMLVASLAGVPLALHSSAH
jgi:DNA polymerase-3 subunit delta